MIAAPSPAAVEQSTEVLLVVLLLWRCAETDKNNDINVAAVWDGR